MTNKEMLIAYRRNIEVIPPDENGEIRFGHYDRINKEYLLKTLEDKINEESI